MKIHLALCLMTAALTCSVAMTLENWSAYQAYQSENHSFHSGTITLYHQGRVVNLSVNDAGAFNQAMKHARQAVANGVPLHLQGRIFDLVEVVSGTIHTHQNSRPSDGDVALPNCSCHSRSNWFSADGLQRNLNAAIR